MSERRRAIISVVLKLLLVLSTTVGLILCFTSAGGFMGGSTLILYFTIQSNIWIALCDLIMALCYIKAIRGGRYTLNKKAYLVQQVFTVSITLTGFVYCFVLAPAFMAVGSGFNPFSITQLLVHVITPLLAIVDFIGFTRGREFRKYDFLFSAIPPLYYLGFSVAGYFLNWDFGGGANYPYFFLNYGSPVGLFGFGGEVPYFMGSGYWIAIIVVFVLLVSLAYIKIVNNRIRKLPSRI